MREELQQYYMDKNYDHNEDWQDELHMEIIEVRKFDDLYDKYKFNIIQLIKIANSELEQIASVIDISLNTNVP